MSTSHLLLVLHTSIRYTPHSQQKSCVVNLFLRAGDRDRTQEQVFANRHRGTGLRLYVIKQRTALTGHRGLYLIQTTQSSGVARGGFGGFKPLHCERSCIFYCLVIE